MNTDMRSDEIPGRVNKKGLFKKILIILSSALIFIVSMYLFIPRFAYLGDVYLSTGPNKIALLFVDEVASGHIDQAYSKTTKLFQGQISREQFMSEITRFASTGGVVSHTYGIIRDEKILNDKASFGWALTTADRVGQYAGYYVAVSLKRDNDEWRVDGFTVRDQKTDDSFIKLQIIE